MPLDPDSPAQPASPSLGRRALITALARAYMEKERQRVGIPEQERTAAESQTSNLVRQAQVARIAQELELAPAEHESELEHRRVQNDLYGAQTDAARALAAQRDTGGPPPDTGSFEDFTIRYAKEKGVTPRQLTTQQIAEARRIFNQADDRAPRPDRVLISVWTGAYDKAGNPIMRHAPRGEVAGSESPALPTNAERNVAAGVTAEQQKVKNARLRAAPVLKDLGSRARALNKGGEGGLGERIGGIGRNAAGRMGMDSAADLYRTGVRGFTTYLARAVGHVGVLTELDMERTEELFPRIGDSEATTEEKLNRLQRIATGQEPLPFQWEHPEYDEQGITQQPDAPALGGGPAAPGAVEFVRDPVTKKLVRKK